MPVIPRALLSTLVDVTVSMSALVVTVEVLLPRMVYRKRIALFFACFAALVLLGGTLIILTQLKLLDHSLSDYHRDVARSQGHYFYWFWADLVFGSYFMVFFISSVGAAVQLAVGRLQAEHQLEKIQKEKAMSELELLKQQINPHFLFNALNTIYYKIDRSNVPARETLQRFSNMLRYQLYECNHPFVEVEKELSFIRSYIDLQRERLNDNYRITCEGIDEVKGFSISPFLLMPIIENCFKHVAGHPDKLNAIDISCCVEGNTFRLQTRNSVSGEQDPAPGTEGIGLENVRRRLGHLYAGRHELTSRRNEERYEATLVLRIA
ncbi:MAG: histidine kinase [Bacteroidota bacterium]|nr:histidine kinase [Bacteroidota bacterium]MDP4216680.1 histidine kinase [Bacteroidota bacterium]MDP4244216.1 histidine kinase [Bacteroidota bacterium]MDP4253412.1 histidine kinase [Bacteroidota bacterium]MDP4258876.1 histidine kinase [Bacteroidota bacterium]